MSASFHNSVAQLKDAVTQESQVQRSDDAEKGWLSAPSAVETLTLVIAFASALYARSQRNVAIAARETAKEANDIARNAQKEAQALAGKTAELDDMLDKYNDELANPARAFLLDLLNIPSELKADMEYGRYDEAAFLQRWAVCRAKLASLKEMMRRELKTQIIDATSFQQCFESDAYDTLARTGGDLADQGAQGRLERIEKFDASIKHYDSILQNALNLGRSSLIAKALQPRA